MNRLVPAVCLAGLGWLTWAGTGVACCASAARPDGVTRPDPAALVARLGDPSYEVREEAAKGLVALGRTAEAAVARGLEDPDLEVRRQCAQLLPLVRRSDEDIRVDDFLVTGSEVGTAGAAGAAPLLGWAKFKELAGGDLGARRLYVELLRADRPLLETLARDPRAVGAQLAQRRQQVQQRFMFVQGKRPDGKEISTAEVAGCLLAAAAAQQGGALDVQGFYQLTNILFQPSVRACVEGNPAVGRLLEPVLKKYVADANTSHQALYLVVNLGLTELIETTVKPQIHKELAAAREGKGDLNKVQVAVNLAGQLGLQESIASEVRPLVQKLADEFAKTPTDMSKFYQVMNLAQQLNLRDVLDNSVKPAVLRMMAAAAEKDDVSALQQAMYPAQNLGMNDEIEAVLKPAAHRKVMAALRQPGDPNRLMQVLYLVQGMNMAETKEAVLKPAARRQVLAMLEKSDGVNELQQAVMTARNFGLQDLVEETVKPLTRQAAARAGASGDLNAVTQVYNLAQMLGMPDLIEKEVKPALQKAFANAASAKDVPVNQGTVYATLSLAQNLGMKEALPYAVKVAKTGSVPGYARGQALLLMAKLGDKELIPTVEGMLGDKTNIGALGINNMTLQAELRDLALAVLVKLTGQSLSDYGFPFFQMIPGATLTDNSPSVAGFGGTAAREAALKKWKEWRAAEKK